jgi:hypothetical protein
MGVLLDGIYVLKLYKDGVLIFFATVLGLGGWGMGFFLADYRRALVPKLSLAISFGSMVLVLLTFALVVVARIWSPILKYGSLLVLVIALAALLDWIRRDKSVRGSVDFLFFCLLLALILLVRLAFLRGIILPPYDDSPEHYMIVRDLLTPGETSNAFYSIDTITNHYYHYGFHTLAAWISSISNLDVADSISLLGQLFLTILPISILLLVDGTTHNDVAGFIAMLMSAFAWRMPAFAANWGKYPAIAGLSLFPSVIALWIYYWRMPKRNITITLMLIFTTTGLMFLHTRLAICLSLVLLSFVLARRLLGLLDLSYWKVFLLISLAVAVFLSLRGYLMTFYGNGYDLALILIMLLLPFAFYHSPELTLSTMLFILGIWALSHIDILSHVYGTALLDDPFIEILLCVPLSFLGGVGCAGLLDRLRRPALRWTALFTIVTVIAFSFLSADSVYPDECCNYVKPGDIEAIQWLEKNAPQDATIWIAAFQPKRYLIATDAGAWIYPLTGRNANKLNFDFEWSAPNSLDRVCRPNYKDVYVYEANGSYSFANKILTEQNWLIPVFTSGESIVYKIQVPCVQGSND